MLGDQAQHLVAGQVAKAVVDRLEVVNVHYHQQQAAAVALPAFKLFVHALLQTAAVGQPGEAVDQRLLALLFKVMAEGLSLHLHGLDTFDHGAQPYGHFAVACFAQLPGLVDVFQQRVQPRFDVGLE